MVVDKWKVLERVKDIPVEYESQDHNKVLHFLEGGNPSQFYLKQICVKAGVPFEEVEKEYPTNRMQNIDNCTVELYNDFLQFKGD